jgi:hypothetical protein
MKDTPKLKDAVGSHGMHPSLVSPGPKGKRSVHFKPLNDGMYDRPDGLPSGSYLVSEFGSGKTGLRGVARLSPDVAQAKWFALKQAGWTEQ